MVYDSGMDTREAGRLGGLRAAENMTADARVARAIKASAAAKVRRDEKRQATSGE